MLAQELRFWSFVCQHKRQTQQKRATDQLFVGVRLNSPSNSKVLGQTQIHFKSTRFPVFTEVPSKHEQHKSAKQFCCFFLLSFTSYKSRKVCSEPQHVLLPSNRKIYLQKKVVQKFQYLHNMAHFASLCSKWVLKCPVA